MDRTETISRGSISSRIKEYKKPAEFSLTDLPKYFKNHKVKDAIKPVKPVKPLFRDLPFELKE